MTTQHITQDSASSKLAGSWCRDHQHKTYSFEDALQLIRQFHGYPAPGLLLGVKMVSHAMDHVPEDILFNTICETSSCLPDAVQILTLCTIGNAWLKVIDIGKFAVTLYDKSNGKGCRVFLDPRKLNQWPEIYTWFYKLKNKQNQDTDRLLNEIQTAGAQLLTLQEVQIQERYLAKKSKGTVITCPICHEAFPEKDGAICKGCRGETPYSSPQNKHSR